MKAIVRFRDRYTNRNRQRTIEVTKNEPNTIVREFVKATGVVPTTYITTIKCGRIEYQWFDDARPAGTYEWWNRV